MTRGFAPALFVFGMLVAVTGAIGGRFTARGIGPWYDSLAKPSWTPPGAFIGVAWAVLYALIAVASALVWSRGGGVRYAAVLLANLVLNAAWSWLFFARRDPHGALIELVVLEITCLGLIALAARVSRPAALLLLPYAAWVVFAGFLNAAVARMN